MYPLTNKLESAQTPEWCCSFLSSSHCASATTVLAWFSSLYTFRASAFFVGVVVAAVAAASLAR